MAVSKRLRFEILNRDNNTCRYCGRKPPEVELTVDHVVPVALGGGDEPANLVAACKDCNAGKSSSSPDAPLVADVADSAVKWGAALAQWARDQRERRYEKACYVDRFTDAWDEWTWGPANKRQPLPRPSDWMATIWSFHEAGLPIEELEEAAAIACSNDRVKADATWRYMCGVAWKKVTKMQEGARALLDAQPPEGPAESDDWTDGVSADEQRGWTLAYGMFAYSDHPNRLLVDHIDGRRSDYMRWVA
jgi:hypothetical protein